MIYQRFLALATEHETYLFTIDGSSIVDELKGKITLVSLSDYLGVKPGLFGILVFYLLALPVVLQLDRKKGFDIVYTFREFTSVIGFIIYLLRRKKWASDIFDDPALDLINMRQSKNFLSLKYFFLSVLDQIMRRILKYADLVIVVGVNVNEGLPNRMMLKYDVNPSRMCIVPNGIDFETVRPKSIGKKSACFDIFYVGLVSRLRGLETLVTATKILVTDIPNLRLTLAGPIKKEEEMWLRNTVQGFGLEACVSWLGTTASDRVQTLIELSDVCVYPFSHREELNCVLPVKVFEYMALNKPVVATALPGITHIIEHEYNGILVPPDNPKEMAEAIFRLYKDTKLRNKIETVARESISKYDAKFINKEVTLRLGSLLTSRTR